MHNSSQSLQHHCVLPLVCNSREHLSTRDEVAKSTGAHPVRVQHRGKERAPLVNLGTGSDSQDGRHRTLCDDVRNDSANPPHIEVVVCCARFA